MSSTEHDAVEHEALSDARGEVRRAEIAADYRGPTTLEPSYIPRLVDTPPAHISRLPQDFEHLEDLYAKYKIGDGRFVLRVERDQPKSFDGVRTAGWLCDLDEQITTKQFGDLFGGGQYSVYVRSFNKDATDVSGAPQQKTVASVTIQIPGKPRLAASENVSQMNTSGIGSGVGEQRYLIEMAKLAETREARSSAEQPKLLREVSEMVEAQSTKATLPWIERIKELQAECSRLRDSIGAKDAEVDKIRRDMLDKDRDHTVQMALRESARERDLQAKHDQERLRLAEEHRREIDVMRREFEAYKETIRRDHEQRLEGLRSDHAKELTRIGETERNERMRLQTDAQREQARVSESFNAQLSAVQRELERTRSDAREQHERDLRIQKQSHDQTLQFTKESLVAQLETLRSDLARAHGELSTAKAELDRVRRELFKSPLKAITEARDLIEQVSPADKDEPAEQVPATWQGAIAKVAESALPALMQMMGPRQSPLPAQPHQMPPGMAPQLPPGQMQQMAGQRPPMQQQMQRPQPLRQRPRPHWMVGGGPAEPSFIPPAADAPIVSARPRAVIPTAGGPVQAGSRTAPPLSGEPQQWSPPEEQVQMQPPPAQQQAFQQQPPQQQAVQSQQPAPDMAQIDQAFSRVNAAILGGVPAGEFAQQLVQELGVPTVNMIVSTVTPDQVVASVSQSPAGADSVLPTIEGRQYLSALWDEARRIISQ